MTREHELLEIIRLHKEWLDTENRQGKRADLSGAMLDGVNLSNIDLSGALLRGASLKQARLSGSRFFHSDFSNANLSEADLSNANLILADFSDADLRHANLSTSCKPKDGDVGQNRRGPKFRDANLQNANLTACWCHASDFSGANLHKTCFSEANLEQADLSNNKLNSLDFSRARLVDAHIQDSDLREANLREACLDGASLANAILVKTDFTNADLRSANLERCKVDDVQYSRQTLFRGIRLDGCFGSSRFKRFAEDQDYIEEFKEAHHLSYLVWLALTDCGRSMIRVVLWSMTFSLAFGMIYFSLGPQALEIHNPNGLQWNLFTTIYYSVVTFTTLGFGDITPNTPLAAAIVITEVVMGYVMLGILISILATKVARRS